MHSDAIHGDFVLRMLLVVRVQRGAQLNRRQERVVARLEEDQLRLRKVARVGLHDGSKQRLLAALDFEGIVQATRLRQRLLPMGTEHQRHTEVHELPGHQLVDVLALRCVSQALLSQVQELVTLCVGDDEVGDRHILAHRRGVGDLIVFYGVWHAFHRASVRVFLLPLRKLQRSNGRGCTLFELLKRGCCHQQVPAITHILPQHKGLLHRHPVQSVPQIPHIRTPRHTHAAQ
mmetsp:Transcript_47907/g.97522  ORF Transcript_47907/g.97522 Transcript_47907/m.97522 type:complete len:232 (+) Transcript_47907:183-878(+)